MDLEQKYDAMSVYERENADLYYQSWVEQFEQAKASGDDMNVIQLIYSTKEPYCLWKILQYLKPIAELEPSSDPLEHWRGYLAKINVNVCRRAIAAHTDDGGDDVFFMT